MALTDSEDSNKDFLNALTYMGKGPFNIGLPGGGEMGMGAGAAPPVGGVGSFGQVMSEGGAPARPGGIASGADTLGLIQKYLGAAGKSADFANKLRGTDQGTQPPMDILKEMAASGQLNLGDLGLDLSGLGLTELPNTTLSSGGGDFAGILSDLKGSLGSTSLSDPTLGLNLSTELGSEAGAATGAMGGLGTGASGAGALAAILGAIAAQTGNKDLGMAASAIGDVAGVAGTAAAAPGAIAGAAGAAGGAGVGSAAAGGLSAIGGAAGLAYAPVAAALLIDSIMQMAGSKDAPNLIGSAMEGSMGNYPFFNKGLIQGEGQQGQALRTLQEALPYAASKEELGELLNTYKNYLSTTTGDPLTGGGEGIYDVQTIPGTGPMTHGQQTPSFDWGPQTKSLQDEVNALRGVLPGEDLTKTYAEGGGLQGPDAMRLWTQFLDRGTVAPEFLPNDIAPGIINAGMPGEANTPGFAKGFYNPYQLSVGGNEAMNQALRYGQEGYDYAGAGFPEPGKFFGSVSPEYQALVAQLAAQQGGAPGGPSGAVPPEVLTAMAGGSMAPSGGEALPDTYIDWLKQQQAA